MSVASRLVSLLGVSSLAVLLCSLHTAPVAALAVDSPGARSLHHHAHDALARRKRAASSKRCKPRPAPSAAPSSSAADAAPSPSPSSSADASPSPAPSPSPSPAPAPSPSPAGSSSAAAPASSPAASAGGGVTVGGSSKAGLGWSNGPQWLDQWKGVSTIYTWSPACPDNANSLGIVCCPMLWGWAQVGQWQSSVMNTNPSCVMGPNEPEIGGQSNMDAGSGVQIWNQYVRPMKAKGATLISPATTSDPAGKQWMLDFFSICGGDCGVDIVAAHWYDVSGDALIAYLNDLHDTYKKPLWLTEFACQNFNGGAQCSSGDVWGFQAQVTAFMESASFVLKYMPFGAMQNMQGVNTFNQLMNSDGSPNALAKAYFGL